MEAENKCQHPAVRKVNFTGSTSVGRKIAKICGQNLKPCLMELGGKNNAIVLEDADIPKAVEACVAGGMINVSLVEDSQAKKLTEAGRSDLHGNRSHTRT